VEILQDPRQSRPVNKKQEVGGVRWTQTGRNVAKRTSPPPVLSRITQMRAPAMHVHTALQFP
jgi:hypothetical protein